MKTIVKISGVKKYFIRKFNLPEQVIKKLLRHPKKNQNVIRRKMFSAYLKGQSLSSIKRLCSTMLFCLFYLARSELCEPTLQHIITPAPKSEAHKNTLKLKNRKS